MLFVRYFFEYVAAIVHASSRKNSFLARVTKISNAIRHLSNDGVSFWNASLQIL